MEDGKVDGMELGTPEAAVRSCVKLMSMLFEQPEKYVAFYLDLYYQVRLAYERGREPPPLRREDLIPAMREIWEGLLAEDASGQNGTGVDAAGQDSPKPARRKGSGKKADKAANTPGKPESRPQAAAQTSSECRTSPARQNAPAGEPTTEGAESKLGTWTIYKRKQLDRLRAAREAGLTLAQIEKEDPVLKVRTVTNMLGGQYATRDSWNALEKAMDRWDKRRAAALDAIKAEKGTS